MRGTPAALNRDDALGGVLAEVADALEIGGDADRTHDLAKVGGHRLAAGDGDDRLVADLAFGVIEDHVVGDDLLGESGVAVDQRADGVATPSARRGRPFPRYGGTGISDRRRRRRRYVSMP